MNSLTLHLSLPAGTVLNIVSTDDATFRSLYPDVPLIIYANWTPDFQGTGSTNPILLFRNSTVVDRYDVFEGQSDGRRVWEYDRSFAYRLYNLV